MYEFDFLSYAFFLGLAGIPRRIPDYPDVYSGWNAFSSFTSLDGMPLVVVSPRMFL